MRPDTIADSCPNKDPTHLAYTECYNYTICLRSLLLVSQPTACAMLLQNPVILNAREVRAINTLHPILPHESDTLQYQILQYLFSHTAIYLLTFCNRQPEVTTLFS